MEDSGAIITRIRVNVSTSVKGVKTFDATVEMTGEGVTKEMVLAEHDALVQELDQRYPAVEA
jgi:hypothetical protein